MKTSIILGLGYGDEGKGITTDYLAKQTSNSLVVRFSGGHQAGHTVVDESGHRHVFSSFGAGSLRAVPTYCSRYCTLYPIGFLNEFMALEMAGHRPKIYVDALTQVTTPYDLYHNRNTEKKQQHGSCGLGFGATIARNKTPYKLYVQDLFYPTVLEQKLNAIAFYYQQKSNLIPSEPLLALLGNFHEAVQHILPLITLVQEADFFKNNHYEHIIFEGSQGILLDMDHGFFPNVTYASTTSKNALEIIQRNKLTLPEIYYITRAYQTRHGNGFLSNENLKPNITPNPNETNQYNEWQKNQRLSILDIDLLEYALQCDKNYSSNLQKHLVITCLDQLKGKIEATKQGKRISYQTAKDLKNDLKIKGNLLESQSDCSSDMVECRRTFL